MPQEKKTKSKAEAEEVEEVAEKDLSNEELDASVEDILADIDDVLEENAEEFVQGYIQKGGQ